MTVSSDYTPHSYKPGSAMAPEPIPFQYLDPTDIVVTHVAAATGDRTLLGGPDYVLSGDGAAEAGRITATAVWPADDVFEIARATPRRQKVALKPTEPLPSGDLNRQFDRDALVLQEVDHRLNDTRGRALLAPAGETAPPLPVLAARQNKFAVFGADGGLTGQALSPGLDGDKPLIVDSRTVMANLAAPAAGQAVRLTEAGAEGDFTARAAGDLDSDSVDGDTGQGVYVPSATDAAYVFVRRYEWLKPEHFGDVDSPANCGLAIQRTLDMAGKLGAGVRLGSRLYETKRPLFLPSGVAVEAEGPEAAIRNSLTYSEASGYGGHADGVLPYSTLYTGWTHPIYMPSFDGGGYGTSGGAGKRYFTWYTGLADIAAGEDGISLSATDAANLGAGVTVWLRATAYTSQVQGDGRNHVPLVLIPMRVARVSASGRVTFERSCPVAITDPLVARTDGAVNPNSGEPERDNLDLYPVYCCANARWHGVSLVSAPAGGGEALGNGLFPAAGYALDLDIPRVAGQHGAGLNGFGFCRVRIGSVESIRKLAELAMGSIENTFEIGHASYRWIDGISSDNILKIGEHARHNRIRIGRLTSYGQDDAAKYLIYISSGSDNVVRIAGGTAGGTWGGAVSFLARAAGAWDPNQAVTVNSGNIVDADLDLTGATMTRSIYMVCETVQDDGLASLRDATVRGALRGVTPTRRAVTMAGLRPTINATIDHGGIRWSLNGTAAVSDADVLVSGGATFENYERALTKRAVLNGFVHAAAATPVALDGGGGELTIAPDMATPSQRITVTNATGIVLSAPTSSGEGKTLRLELVNDTGAAITPSVINGFYALNGAALPAIADGAALTLYFEQIYRPAGGIRLALARPVPDAV